MAKESTLTLTLKVDDQGTVVLDKFTKQVQKASDDVTKMSKAMQVVSVAAFINIAQQAINAANQVYNFTRSIASAGNDIQRMSKVFNMSTDDLQKWSYVAKMADVDIEGFGQGFKFLTRSMSEALQGSGDAAFAFKVLGINLKDTTGRTKDQQTVMMETIGALGRFADGVNRDSLMLAIFGRGWMSIKPLIDQGTKAIEENRMEAERLNVILGKDTIKALTEAEDAYKRWEAVWKVSKTEFWTPMVKTFSDLLEKILALKVAFREGGFGGLWEKISEHEMEAMEEQAWKFYGGPSERVKSWVAGWEPMKAEKKPEAPETGIWTLYGMSRERYENIKAGREEILEWRTEWIKMLPDMPVYETITRELEKEVKINEDLYEYGKAINKTWQEMEGYIPLDKLREMDTEIAKMAATASTWAAQGGYEMFGYEVMDTVPGKLKKIEEEYKKIDDVVQEFASSLSSTWSTTVSGMIKGTETFASGVKKLFQGILESFINVISKMISQWLLFGSITGEKGGTSFFGKSAGGWGGIIGGLLNIFKLQEGGVFNRPTPAIIGEAGPEAVIPLKEGKIPIEGGRQTVIHHYFFNIRAVDAPSFIELCRRSPAGILQAVGEDAKSAGSMRNVIRGT